MLKLAKSNYLGVTAKAVKIGKIRKFNWIFSAKSMKMAKFEVKIGFFQLKNVKIGKIWSFGFF